MVRANEQVVMDARQQLLTIASESFQHSLTSLPEVGYVRGVEKQIRSDEEQAKKASKKPTPKKRVTKKAAKKTVKKATS